MLIGLREKELCLQLIPTKKAHQSKSKSKVDGLARFYPFCHISPFECDCCAEGDRTKHLCLARSQIEGRAKCGYLPTAPH